MFLLDSKRLYAPAPPARTCAAGSLRFRWLDGDVSAEFSQGQSYRLAHPAGAFRNKREFRVRRHGHIPERDDPLILVSWS